MFVKWPIFIFVYSVIYSPVVSYCKIFYGELKLYSM